MFQTTEKQYDIVIAGAGLGGLLCGAILGREGLEVCVLEKNEQIGGCLQTFRRDGLALDTGIHYIGSLGQGQILFQILQYLGVMDRLELTKMDESGYDMILFKDDETQYPHGMGYDNFINLLSEKFPAERSALIRYCDEIKATCQTFMLYNLSAEEKYDDPDLLSRSARSMIESLTPDRKLRAVLAGSNMLYAGDAERTPWYVHALIANSFIESSWRCTKGGSQLAGLLAREIKANGGEIRTKSAVKSIKEENGRAIYLELDNGNKIYGKKFISNIHPVVTMDLLDSAIIRPAYRNRLKLLDNSVSAFVLNLVLKPGTYKYTNRNYYYFEDADVWDCIHYTEDNWPRTFGIFEAVPCEGRGARDTLHSYVETLSVMTYMKSDEVARWQDTVNTSLKAQPPNPQWGLKYTQSGYSDAPGQRLFKPSSGLRGDSYEDFKREKAQKLLEKVGLRFPDIVKNIESCYASTPLTYRDYLASPQGSIYGIVQDCSHPVRTQISPNTRIPNLYLTGQNIKLHGVLGVALSAIVTCSSILGKEYLVNKIIQSNEAFA